ncbi:MAG: OmpA family protein [Alphaproteobacteria bacterium]|nr:OmpA family protein [Alphaproteobacteria bacterium]
MNKTTLRRAPTEYTSGNSWMLTFADLLSLLLTFFVLVFSMNSVQFDSWKAVVRTMSDEFNPNRPQVSVTEHETPPSILQARQSGLRLNYLEAVFKRHFNKLPQFQTGQVHRFEDRIFISIPATVLFERKEALPNESAVEGLRALAGVLVQVRNKIQVTAHTDKAPVANRLFRSNWELSLTRARVVAGILADAGYRDPIAVLGYADTRFDQLPGSLTAERRYDLAERIDIVILDEGRDRGLYDIF